MNALGGSFNDNARLIAKQLNDQAGAANQLSAQQLANQNVGTFRAGQFQSINDLLLAQAAAGGALKNLGVSQQQFNELLAVAGTTASGGSDAGTSVKAFINAAANASKEQAAAQSALGFNIADDQGQFNSALALSQQLSAARLNGINAIIETGGGKAAVIDFSYEVEPLPGSYPLPILGPLRLLKVTRLNHWGKLAFRLIYWYLMLPARYLPVGRHFSMRGKHRPNAGNA